MFKIKKGDNNLNKVVKALIKYKKIIIISILLVVSLILLSSFVYLISIEDGTYNEDDWANTPYVVSNYTNSAQIGSDGITTEKTKDEIWDSLVAEGSNVSKYLDSSDELQKLMNAELVTQYPKIDGADEDSVNGIIEFQRNKTDGTKNTLKYMDRDKFEENIDSGVEKLSDGTSILDYFTLDTSGNVEIAVVNTETYEVKSGDENFDINSLKNDGIEYGGLSEEDKINGGDKYYNSKYLKIERNITTKTINYKSVVDKYTMPFQYLWALLVIGEDKDFVLELADLVEESEIVISIYDNVTTTTYEDTYEYTESKETNKNITVIVNDPNSLKVKNHYPKSYGPSTSDTTYSAYITRKYESNTVNVDLTKADVWMVDYSKEYSYQSEETATDDEEKRNLNDIEGASSVSDSNINLTLLGDSDAVTYAKIMRDEYISKKYSNQSSNMTTYTYEEITQEVSRVVIDIKINKINRSVSTKTTTVEQNYIEGDVVNNPKVSKKAEDGKENFVSLLCKGKHKNAKNRICSEVTDWFIEILENNPDTVNMVDLTKYLLYKVTGTDYGVTDYDFSTYEESSFNTINTSTGTDQLIRFIHEWENSGGAKTNEDGTMYQIEDDGAGNPVAGYGVDINAHRSAFVEKGYPTTIGEYVPIDFVDALEDEEIEKKINYVATVTSGLGLTDYQINALVSRVYNCGEGGITNSKDGKDFVQAYKAYWNQETDDQFEAKNSEANFEHLLYTKYMSSPTTSKGKYLPGLENRRKSEWTLFQTGYYDKLKEWHIEMGDSIVETAKIIHEYMEKNKYSYCVYGGNSYEECGKTTANGSKHGLSTTFEKSKTEYKHSCCATYVSWVLQECGYLEDSEHTDGANDLQSKLIAKGWKRISSVSELQPGDILCYNHHVEIYAGDNKIYNAGSGKTIREASPKKRSKTFSYALRAPNQ